MLITDEEVYVLSMALTVALNEYNRRVGNKVLLPATTDSLLFTYGAICTQTEISTDFLNKAEVWHREHPDMQAKIISRLETSGRTIDGLIDLNGRRLGRK